jgi:hypothetical protein
VQNFALLLVKHVLWRKEEKKQKEEKKEG